MVGAKEMSGHALGKKKNEAERLKKDIALLAKKLDGLNEEISDLQNQETKKVFFSFGRHLNPLSLILLPSSRLDHSPPPFPTFLNKNLTYGVKISSLALAIDQWREGEGHQELEKVVKVERASKEMGKKGSSSEGHDLLPHPLLSIQEEDLTLYPLKEMINRKPLLPPPNLLHLLIILHALAPTPLLQTFPRASFPPLPSPPLVPPLLIRPLFPPPQAALCSPALALSFLFPLLLLSLPLVLFETEVSLLTPKMYLSAESPPPNLHPLKIVLTPLPPHPLLALLLLVLLILLFPLLLLFLLLLPSPSLPFLPPLLLSLFLPPLPHLNVPPHHLLIPPLPSQVELHGWLAREVGRGVVGNGEG